MNVEAIGPFRMFQHLDEIVPFTKWARPVVNVIEIGTLNGGTTDILHRISTGLVISIDLPNGPHGGKDHGYDYGEMIRRNEKLEQQLPRARFVIGDSHDYALQTMVRSLIRQFPVDLLFIDGDHSLLGVTRDFLDYSPLVRPGGIVAFHDINTSPEHDPCGCYVRPLWDDLKRRYPTRTHEFIKAGATWGGIGALVMP